MITMITMIRMTRALAGGVLAGIALGATAPAAAAETILIQEGSPMRFLANHTNPGLGTTWVQPAFDDDAWSAGAYGIGYETALPGASNLISTSVPSGAFSIYTRAEFTIPDVSAITSLALGADYDDGFVAWINGVEVYRSPQIPSGTPAWNTNASQHESSNGTNPVYTPLQNVSALGVPALQSGTNVLALGVWNGGTGSSDLVVVPYLSFNTGGSAMTRGPYLQLGTPNSIVVRWRTGAVSNSRVRYGLSPASLTSFADNLTVTTEHVVALSGLTPGTRYYYSVGTTTAPLAGGDSSHYFVTGPPSGTGTPTRIWVLGDSGTANANARAVRDAYTNVTGPSLTDLWLMLGDNAYPDGTDAEYQAAVFAMYPQMLRSSVLWPTLGNHDGRSADSATQTGAYYNMFTLPAQAQAGGMASGTEAYYSFDFGNIHFICLDSFETDRSPTGAMLTWLEEDVMATNREWVIAFWHHPPYTKGSHDSDNETELEEMRANALPILEAAGVDLVMTGHSHSYERSFLLDGHYGVSSTLTSAMILDGGDGRVDGDGAYLKLPGPPSAHDGSVHIVAGSSGQISGGSLDHPAMFLSLNVLGSLVLEVSGPQLNARFLSNAGVWRDYFTIYKGTGSPCALPPPDQGNTLRMGPGSGAISWTRDPTSAFSNLYRGSRLAGTPFTYNHSCRVAGTASQSAIDSSNPPPGGFHYYVVSGTNACGEGPLGASSSSAVHPNTSPCP